MYLRNPSEKEIMMNEKSRKKIVVKYHSADKGNCRLYFKSDSHSYCLQLDTHKTAIWHTITDQGEPDIPLRNIDFVDDNGNPIVFSLTADVTVVDAQL